MLSTFWSGIDCGVVGNVAAPVLGVPNTLDGETRRGYTRAAIWLSLPGVTVPAGQVLSVDVLLETDDDAAFPSPTVIADYVGCPVECDVLDNTNGTNGDGTGDFSGDVCILVPLKCVTDAEEFVRAEVTVDGGAGVVIGALDYGYLRAGGPVSLPTCQ